MTSKMRYLIIPALVVALSACVGGEDFAYDGPDEIKSGPGLFTGKDGVYSFSVPYPD
ncbi:MAG: hypothetical protein GY791_18655 [Alphaproteobacteria bacterium]|nr:hypothetical protein [Alphaproteobacteria bacterium]